jgi:sugar phosphate isomerase/epimerase
MHLGCRDTTYLQEISSLAHESQLFLEYGAMGIDYSYLLDELDICLKLNSSILRTFIGFNRYDKKTNISLEIQNAIHQLNKIKKQAEDLNIKIAIENHGDVTSDELLYIVEKVSSPNVGICLDLGNPLFTMEDPITATEKMAPYAFTTHFKDYAIQMTNYGFKVCGVALGDGNIDLEAGLKILKETSSLNKIILELPIEAQSDELLTLKTEDEIVTRSVQYARAVLRINQQNV